MKLEEAKATLPNLTKYVGLEVQSKKLKIKKFLIVPAYNPQISQFIHSYIIRSEKEDEIINDLFKQETEFNIIGQYDTERSNFDYIYVTDLLKLFNSDFEHLKITANLMHDLTIVLKSYTTVEIDNRNVFLLKIKDVSNPILNQNQYSDLIQTITKNTLNFISDKYPYRKENLYFEISYPYHPTHTFFYSKN